MSLKVRKHVRELSGAVCDGKFGGKFSNYNIGKDITFLLTAIINYIQTKGAIGRG